MPASDPTALFAELARRRFISAEALTRATSGNIDRAQHDTAWIAKSPDGMSLRLRVGLGLAARAARQEAFARDCPSLIVAPLFFERIGDFEILAEPFIRGATLEEKIAANQMAAPQAARALTDVIAALDETARPSTESARRSEWESFAASILESSFWAPAEREVLQAEILPALFPAIATGRPTLRWSNGDFTASNILVSDAGETRLIDHEFAALTHFHAEDSVRFHALSPSARASSEAFLRALPPPVPAWHLFFWLRQSALEAQQNTKEYVSRVRQRRLRLIRQLAEHVIGKPLIHWPAAPLTVASHLEVARWTHDAGGDLRLSGWCHSAETPIHAAVALHDDTFDICGLTHRPDVQAHFHGVPSAQTTGFDLRFRALSTDAAIHLCALSTEGEFLPFAPLRSGDLPGRGPLQSNFPEWAERHDPDPESVAYTTAGGPLFSILLPVHRTPLHFLSACIASVREQFHSHWELCVVDDGSQDAALSELLEKTSREEPRLRIKLHPTNSGIATATNDALSMARGEFVVLLDHDDLLRPHALSELAAAIARETAVDALYSDEDKITEEGKRSIAFLKPAFSPEYLRGVMYIGHALCVRTAIARAIGGFDPAFNGIQDFEFMLRVSERTQRISHVPRMLYHWRQSAGSSALHGNVKGDMDALQCRAVQAHLDRIRDPRRATALGGHRVQLQPPVDQDFVHRTYARKSVFRPAELMGAATEHPQRVLVFGREGDPAPSGVQSLAALAARPDSACVAPVAVSEDGRVLDGGWATGSGNNVPTMLGFDAAGDGYNGSLRCNREVAAVSPRCFAIRSDVVLQFPPAAGESWIDYLGRLSSCGLFHRVCANARLTLPRAWRDFANTAEPASSKLSDRFFNPHFDARRADYGFTRWIGHFPPTVRWHLDTPPPASLPEGGLLLRGWAFRLDGAPLRLVAEIAGITWDANCQLARPDVARAYPELTRGDCGFALRLRLPSGAHTLRLSLRTDDLVVARLPDYRLHVPLSAPLSRWLSASPESLLGFQFLAAPSHAPRPVIPERFPTLASPADRPRLAVVTPSFQQERFLEQTIRSVVEQGAPVDYVVQDGGSTDGSVAIIARHAAKLLLWESAPDAGQSDALVRGFAKSKGGADDVMAWLNSDDFYLPGALRYVQQYFAEHPEVDVVYGHRIVVDEEGREIGRWYMPPHDEEVLRLNDFVPQETLFWRRRIWDRAGPVDPSFGFAMDWDLLLRFQAAGARIVRVPYFLACFRVHSAQKTSAVMHSTGEREIQQLRQRANGRHITPAELERNLVLARYLKKSVGIETLWQLGIRAP